ncbi:MAG: hypothetical protein PHW60_03735 [Kiritimatiellae bacterium]|nr:hypothetical protein [Kiritimatiellia bacterium]
MNVCLSINALLAGIIGVITAIVSWRVLRHALKITNPVLGICIGALTGLGLANLGGIMTGLLIPYETLGIVIVLMFLIASLLNRKKDKKKKPSSPEPMNNRWESEDPWTREIRLKVSMVRKLKAGKR